MTLPAGNNLASNDDNEGTAPYVVVIGGMNIDIHGTPAGKLMASDSNPGTVRTSPGGVARNVAENLARLSADCRLISVVGNDPHGDLLLEQGRAAGVEMQHVIQQDSVPTSTYLSVLNESGDMHVAISDMESIDQLTSQRLQVHQQLLRQAALIVIDTNLSEDVLAWLTSSIKDQFLFVDTVSTSKAVKITPYLGGVHTLKTNLIEAEAISGLTADADDGLPGVADWFHRQGVDRVFVTLGRRGVFYSNGDVQEIQPPPSLQEAPTNAGGAGDAFMAGLAYGWLNQWETNKTVGSAQAAASITLTDWQTNSPRLSLEQVARIYESNYAN